MSLPRTKPLGHPRPTQTSSPRNSSLETRHRMGVRPRRRARRYGPRPFDVQEVRLGSIAAQDIRVRRSRHSVTFPKSPLAGDGVRRLREACFTLFISAGVAERRPGHFVGIRTAQIICRSYFGGQPQTSAAWPRGVSVLCSGQMDTPLARVSQVPQGGWVVGGESLPRASLTGFPRGQ